MSFKICILASGSSGNAIYISNNNTKILIDAGINSKQLILRLEKIGINPKEIDGICLSHEHSDHTNGVRIFHKKFKTPIFSNNGTFEGYKKISKNNEVFFNIFETSSVFKIGDIDIESFSIPHDAMDPVGFLISNNQKKIGIVTDIGMSTPLVIQKLRGCEIIVIEANYDDDLLNDAPRPWNLKKRIRSRQGHLSNTEAAQLISDCNTDSLKRVILAHLSSDCNTPSTALKTISSHLRLDGLDNIKLEVSSAAEPTDIWET